jgi:hypothetical protein
VRLRYSFSSLGDVLCLLVGLPYKVQVEEAGKMKISMRLKGTRGMHGFMREMEPVSERSHSKPRLPVRALC